MSAEELATCGITGDHDAHGAGWAWCSGLAYCAHASQHEEARSSMGAGQLQSDVRVYLVCDACDRVAGEYTIRNGAPI